MKSQGFTLIEVLVAIFVIIVGTIGSLTLIQQTVVFTDITSSRLVAIYLGQEGIEIVRNTRDSNWLARNAWDLNLLSRTETDILEKFNRTITIARPRPDKIMVSVEVSWRERGRIHRVTVQTELYNWR